MDTTILLKWTTTFCLIHFIHHLIMSAMLKYNIVKSDTLRIYHEDMIKSTTILSELLLGLFIFFLTKNYILRLFVLSVTYCISYWIFTYDDSTFDYSYFYKKYFKENYHFMGMIPLVLSFSIYPFAETLLDIIKEEYACSFLSLFAYYVVITSYQDL